MASVTRSQSNRGAKSDSQRRSEAQTVVRSGKGDLQVSNVPKTTDTNPVGRRYGVAIGPSNVGYVPGGYGITGLSNVRLTPTTNAPRATVTGTRITPAAQQVITNVVRERTSPTPSRTSTTPSRMEVNRVTGKTTGFTSGKTTGTTVTKTGTAYKTNETAYQRAQRLAQEKMGVVGPSRATGGSIYGGPSSSRSTGGGAVGSSSGTRGYSSGGNVGRGDVGAGRRGGGQ